MGWFENQIEERRNADDQLLEDSFVKVAGVVLGKRTAEKIGDARIVSKSAIDEIVKYYHCKPVEVPEAIETTEDQLAYCLRPHGLMYRTVELTEDWYRDAFGPILAFTKEEELPVALLPGAVYGYTYLDLETGKRKRIDKRSAAQFLSEAVCFYRPLPQKKLGIPDLFLYMKSCISMSDVVMIVAATLALTLIGLAMPRITRALTGPVLASGRADALVGIAVCMVGLFLINR